MRETGADVRRAVAVGGGTLNRLWVQIVSDVTGVPQLLPERTMGASYGDAFLAGVATGLVDGVAALRRDWVRITEEVAPDPAAGAAYEAGYHAFRALYAETRQTVHRLARQPTR